MKTRLGIYLFIVSVIVGFTSCEKPDGTHTLQKLTGTCTYIPKEPLTYGSVTDIDGNTYMTIKNGTQAWMVENLKTTRYNDNRPILFSTGGPAGYTDWFSLGKGAYCWYDNDAKYKDSMGAIYNWHAVSTGKLCPTGWHVPTYSEWTALITSLGGIVDSFNEETDNAYIHWINSENYIKGGFTIGSGACIDGWGFGSFDEGSFWWTATPYIKYNFPYAYILSVHIVSDEPQSYGFNVRCFKD